METPVQLLTPAIILFSAGIAGVLLMQKLSLTPILGYFFAGVVIGEHALHWVNDSHVTELLADIGVVFLMFDIGLHLSVARLWAGRQQFLTFGTAQMLSASLLLFLVLWSLNFPVATAFVIASALSLSSTAIVLQLLHEREETMNPVGRIATVILIFQDLMVVILLILMSVLSDPHSHFLVAMSTAIVKAVFALGLVFLLGHYILKPLLRWISHFHSLEIFTAAILLVVLSTATVTGSLGLSLPLGAFLAGLIIAETEFRYQVQAEIQPFRNLLLGLFFITVGMKLDMLFVLSHLFSIIAAVVVLFSIKIGSLLLVTRIFLKTNLGFSTRLAFLLGQGGEFAFVMFAQANANGLLTLEQEQLLMATVGISFVLTPFLVAMSDKIARYLEATGRADPCQLESCVSCQGRVLIAGFGQAGSVVARALTAESIPYLALEQDKNQVAWARSEGYDIAFADPTHPRVLTSAGAERASAIVVALGGKVSCERAKHILHWLKQQHGHIPLFVHTNQADALTQLKELNVNIMIDVERTGYEIAEAVLRHFGVAATQIEGHLKLIKAMDAHDVDLLQQEFG